MRADTEHFWRLDRASLWHPYTKHSLLDGEPFPIITRGEGPYLYDTEGHRYLDAVASWWSCNLGHSHPRLMQAIIGQTRELQQSILGNLSHPRAIELASALVGLFPDPRRRVLFASDGASAVEAALRIAVQYWHNIGQPDRCRFAALKNSYHGDTLGAMSLGYLPSFHAAYESLVLPVLQAAVPDCFECEQQSTARSCNLECFAAMEQLFEAHGRELAAMIVEPLCQGAGGMHVYPAAYLARLSELCRRSGVLLIVDEVAMGFGRTGRMFAFEHAAIDPDLVCLGKSLTGGYLPMSAAVVKEEIFATFADQPEDHTFYHGHTFGGNPIAAAAALECLKIYREEDIVGRAARLGRLLGDALSGFAELPGVRRVRTLGMMGAFELTGSDPAASGAVRAQQLRRNLLRRGILVRPLDNVVYLMLPLIVSEELLLETVHTLRTAILELDAR